MATWGDLNKRQQTYLQAVYEVDQMQEASSKSGGASGRWNNTPASVWRWMPYNAADAPLLNKIQGAGYRDEGTGSTFAALERRGLMLCKYESDAFGFSILFVQITKEGRKMVRDALGIKGPKAPVVGTLQEWHWRALAKAYTAGEHGVREEGIGYGRIGWNTWLRLRDYKIHGVEYPLIRNGVSITPFGIGFYDRSYARYAEMYPAVSAPAPAQVVDPLAPYVEIVQDSRMCQACIGRYLVEITRTYRQDLRWTWSVSETYQRIPGLVTNRYGEVAREQCACQEADIEEQFGPLLALLDRLSAQGYQLQFPRHPWYDYVTFLAGDYYQREDAWYNPTEVGRKLLPLLDDHEMPDERNILKGEVRYCFNEKVGKGGIYSQTAPGNWNNWPVVVTRRDRAR
jgi:hypothetical protein